MSLAVCYAHSDERAALRWARQRLNVEHCGSVPRHTMLATSALGALAGHDTRRSAHASKQRAVASNCMRGVACPGPVAAVQQSTARLRSVLRATASSAPRVLAATAGKMTIREVRLPCCPSSRRVASDWPVDTHTLQVIESLMAHKDLSEQEAEDALRVRLSLAGVRFSCLLTSDQHGVQALLTSADSAQIAAFLVLLRAKGETPAEIAGLARAMRASGLHVNAGPGVLDIVGTGGDKCAPAQCGLDVHAPAFVAAA